MIGKPGMIGDTSHGEKIEKTETFRIYVGDINAQAYFIRCRPFGTKM